MEAIPIAAFRPENSAATCSGSTGTTRPALPVAGVQPSKIFSTTSSNNMTRVGVAELALAEVSVSRSDPLSEVDTTTPTHGRR